MSRIIGVPKFNVKHFFRHSDCYTSHNAEMSTTPGQRIRQRREALGFDHQGEFAKLVGCKQSTLSEIENGESKYPSAEVLTRMCEVLATSARWILYGEEGDISVPTQEEVQLLSSYRDLPEAAKPQLLAFLQMMRGQPLPPKT